MQVELLIRWIDSPKICAEDDYRESAYEILLAAVGTTAVSARSVGSARSKPEKSLTAVAASRMKKALGLKAKTGASRRGKARTTAELMRDQMLIPEAVDMRTRRALSRAAAGQVMYRNHKILKDVLEKRKPFVITQIVLS